MRFIVYSDLHLHCWSYGSKLIEGLNSRLLQQIDVLNQMKKYAMRHGIRDIFCCGDVTHTQGRTDAEVSMAGHAAFSGISAEGIKQWWIPGNHDYKDRAGKIHGLSYLKELGALVEKQEFFLNYTNGTSLAFLPYTESKEELLAFFNNVPVNSICFIHQGVSGVPVNSQIFLDEIFDPAIIPEHVDHVFSGHYHDHKLVSPKLTIPGAPMQHTWGDAGQRRGWLDCTIDVGGVDIKHIESDHPKFIRGLAEPYKEGDWREIIEDTMTAPKIKLSAADFSDLDLIAEEYATKKKLNAHTKSIGKQLRENKYEVPVDKD